MQRRGVLTRSSLTAAGGFMVIAVAMVTGGCIDDRPSGPGRIRDLGGSMSSSDGSGGTTGGGGAASQSSDPGSGGQTGSAAQGGQSAPSTSATADQGGSTSSASAASSGGSSGAGGTLASSINHDAGAPPKDTGAPADTAVVISFANEIQPMLKSNCLSCHGSSRPSAGVRLDSYTAVKTNLNAAKSAISQGIMPPGGGLSADLRQLFQTWVTEGALNN